MHPRSPEPPVLLTCLAALYVLKSGRGAADADGRHVGLRLVLPRLPLNLHCVTQIVTFVFYVVWRAHDISSIVDHSGIPRRGAPYLVDANHVAEHL